MNILLKKLNEPFPDKANFLENILEVCCIGIFVTIMLYFTQPTEMQTYPGNVFLLCSAFGVLTIFISIAYDFVVIKILKIERDLPSWTLKKWIVSMILLITCIAIGNYFLIAYISERMFFSFYTFTEVIKTTWVIGIVPILFSGIMVQLRASRKNQLQADKIVTSLPNNTFTNQNISIFSKNKKNSLDLNAADILFAEAMQNYVSIFFIKEKNVQKEIIRNTLSDVEKQLTDTSVIRCHRSYLINPDRIEKVEGNAQGLRLSMHYLEEKEVPVSRKFIADLKKYQG